VKRFAATVAYDGRGFSGSQRQPSARTVQGELEAAAATLFGTPTPVAFAGRTDAGVHASGQVAAFNAETRHQAQTVERALNAHLPQDVAVRLVREVPGDFDPRRWARRRSYRYTIHQSDSRDPLSRHTAWHIEHPLDTRAMSEAAQALAGRQDFIACSGPLEPGRTSVRTVSKAGWSSHGCFLLFDIEAEAFLPQMVRRIVGALVRVGGHRLEVEEFSRLLRQAEQGAIQPPAPPHGLCLREVLYHEGYLL